MSESSNSSSKSNDMHYSLDDLKTSTPTGGFIPIQRKSKKIVLLTSGIPKSKFASFEDILKK